MRQYYESFLVKLNLSSEVLHSRVLRPKIFSTMIMWAFFLWLRCVSSVVKNTPPFLEGMIAQISQAIHWRPLSMSTAHRFLWTSASSPMPSSSWFSLVSAVPRVAILIALGTKRYHKYQRACASMSRRKFLLVRLKLHFWNRMLYAFHKNIFSL